MQKLHHEMMINKPIIDGIVIVEGKTDTVKLQQLFEVETIETNGSALNAKTINLIKAVAQHKKIILLLDPDGPGEKIRAQLINHVGQCHNVFLTKQDIRKTTKFGVAEAYDDSLIKAFDNLIKFSHTGNSLTWSEYLQFKFDSKQKRALITDYFHISACNHKKLFKWLNLMQINAEQIKGILHV